RRVFGEKISDQRLDDLKEVEFNEILRHRAAARDSIYYSPGYRATPDVEDVLYRGRDVPPFDGEVKVRTICMLVDQWSAELSVKKSLLGEIHTWTQPIMGLCSDEVFTDKTLQYDKKWL